MLVSAYLCLFITLVSSRSVNLLITNLCYLLVHIQRLFTPHHRSQSEESEKAVSAVCFLSKAGPNGHKAMAAAFDDGSVQIFAPSDAFVASKVCITVVLKDKCLSIGVSV